MHPDLSGEDTNNKKPIGSPCFSDGSQLWEKKEHEDHDGPQRAQRSVLCVALVSFVLPANDTIVTR